MSFASLTPREQQTVLQCIRCIRSGRYVDFSEVETRLGVGVDVLDALIATFPLIDDADDESGVCLAINNCMNEVVNGVRIPPAEWQEWFDVDRAEVTETFRRWARLRGWTHTTVR